MKRMYLFAIAIALTAPTVAGAQRATDEERRELEQRLRELRQEIRELERELGRRNVARVWETVRAPVMVSSFNRPRLGVVVRTGRYPESDSLGAMLQAVTPDGPAHEAGLRAGDIVTGFRGQSLANARPNPGERLIELAREMEEGDSVLVTYRRDGDVRSTWVRPEVLDDFAYSIVIPDMDSVAGRLAPAMRVLERAQAVRVMPEIRLSYGFGGTWSDMELVELNDALGRYFGADDGLLVVRAPEDDLLQLEGGDVILRIGGRTPQSPSHAARLLRSYQPGDEIRLEIMRQQRRQELRATVPERERGLFD